MVKTKKNENKQMKYVSGGSLPHLDVQCKCTRNSQKWGTGKKFKPQFNCKKNPPMCLDLKNVLNNCILNRNIVNEDKKSIML